MTRDGRYVLVSNWCSYDLSVISVRKGREVRRILQVTGLEALFDLRAAPAS